MPGPEDSTWDRLRAAASRYADRLNQSKLGKLAEEHHQINVPDKWVDSADAEGRELAVRHPAAVAAIKSLTAKMAPRPVTIPEPGPGGVVSGPISFAEWASKHVPDPHPEQPVIELDEPIVQHTEPADRSEEMAVSRQAAHDAINRAQATRELYELRRQLALRE